MIPHEKNLMFNLNIMKLPLLPTLGWSLDINSLVRTKIACIDK